MQSLQLDLIGKGSTSDMLAWYVVSGPWLTLEAIDVALVRLWRKINQHRKGKKVAMSIIVIFRLIVILIKI